MNNKGTSRRRILLVEDDEVMRELLPALLEIEDDEIHMVASGDAALNWIRTSLPADLILTDLQMPGLEGSALIEALRAAAAGETLLLGMSATRPPESLLRSLDGFVSKPFSGQHLEEAIHLARSARNTSRPPDSTQKTDPAHTDEPQGDPTPVLDEAIFSALAAKFKPDLLSEVYTMTLGDVAQRLKRIQELALAGDVEAMRREAHSIKGGCAWVGARELEQLAAAAEKGTTLNTSSFADFPAACLRLRRMLDAKFPIQT